MFENLPVIPDDPIIDLMGTYLRDPRENKIDFGIGIFKNLDGATPVMRAVKAAEKHLNESQPSKKYLGMEGFTAYSDEMAKLILGPSYKPERTCRLHTAGGSGAVRLIFDTFSEANPDATVWIPAHTWPMHNPMAVRGTLQERSYPYFDQAGQCLDWAGMSATIKAEAKAGDIWLIHGICHNPTGVDLNLEQWREAAEIANEKGLIIMVDMAYQGFAEGLEEDAAGPRLVTDMCEEVILAGSTSKNFGVYRDRIGVALFQCKTPEHVELVRGNFKNHMRISISMPPAFGAETVHHILTTPQLRADWEAELGTMREQVNKSRAGFAEVLKAKTGSDRFDFIARQRGMFSLLGLSDAQVASLRNDHAIYLVGGGRVNMAGLRADQYEIFADALLAVGA